MSNLLKLQTFDEQRKTIAGDPAIRCVVESPRGSAVKFKYDPAMKTFVMGRPLIKGLTYPFDWGFFPSTVGEDGDPLDVMIVHDCRSFSGLMVPGQVIGVLEVIQREGKEKRRNDRFFTVPVDSHREDELNDVDQLPKRLRKELEQFFITTAEIEKREVEIVGWQNPKKAMSLIRSGIERFKQGR